MSKTAQPRENPQGGQALLIILLVMAVVLTIALSIVSRSITNITISQKEEEAARAFSAAEAGVEQALLQGLGTTGTLPAGGTYNTTVTGLAENSKNFQVPVLVSAGESIPVWLVSHASDGSLVCVADNPCFTGDAIKFCWGEEGTAAASSTTPAIEVSILYTTAAGDYSTARVVRGAYDPYTARPDPNNFDKIVETGCSVEGKNYAFGKQISLASLGVPTRLDSTNDAGPQLLRLRLYYNTDRPHPVGVTVDFVGNGNLPRQGTKVVSVGEAGESTRKIEVYQLFEDLPPVFDFSIFSGSGGLTK